MDKLAQADVRRRFYALMLGTTVKPDGQVPGFAKWCDAAPRKTYKQAESLILAAWRKIESGHSDPDEVIIQAVEGLRWYASQPQPVDHAMRPEYAALRFDLRRMVEDQRLRPLELAAILEQRRHEFPEIETGEIEILRAAHDDWQKAHADTMARWKAERA